MPIVASTSKPSSAAANAPIAFARMKPSPSPESNAGRDQECPLQPDGDEDERRRSAERTQRADALPTRGKDRNDHQQHGGHEESVESERHGPEQVVHVAEHGVELLQHFGGKERRCLPPPELLAQPVRIAHRQRPDHERRHGMRLGGRPRRTDARRRVRTSFAGLPVHLPHGLDRNEDRAIPRRSRSLEPADDRQLGVVSVRLR